MSELTYGQKAVGLTFNPSEDKLTHDTVAKVKQNFADLIDLVEDGRTPNDSRFLNSLRTNAVQTLVACQMMVVKVVTWKDEA